MSANYFEAQALALGLQLLRENSSFGLDIEANEKLKKIGLKGGGTLKEYVNGPEKGQKWKVHAIVENVPVQMFGIRNKNGRLYLPESGRRILESGAAENNYAMVDHPLDEATVLHSGAGSFFNIAGGWRGYFLEGNYGYSNLYLIGKNGEHVADVLAGGFPVGTSSVSYGSMLDYYKDPKTQEYVENVVDPETLILSRVSDIVVDPSAGIFATPDQLRMSAPSNVTPARESISIQNTNSTTKSGYSALSEGQIEKRQETQMTPDTQKLLEGNAKYQASAHLKQVSKILAEKNIPSMQEKLQELKAFQQVVEAIPATHAEVVAAQEKLEEAIQSATHAVLTEKSVTSEKLSALEGKYKTASDLLTEARNENKKLVEVIKKLGATSPEDLPKIMEAMTADLEKFKMKEKLQEADLDIFEKENEKIISENEKFRKTHQKLQETSEFLSKQVNLRDSDIVRDIKNRMVMEKDILLLCQDKERLLEDITTLEKKVAYLTRKLKEHGAELDKEPYAGYQNAPKPKMKTFPKEAGSGVQSVETASPSMARQSQAQGYKREGAVMAKGQPLKEAQIKQQAIRQEIVNFFEAKVEEYPALESLRESVMSSKTLFSAAQLVDHFVRNTDDLLLDLREGADQSSEGFTISSKRLKEGTRPSWLQGID
jgi:hypothetical protein